MDSSATNSTLEDKDDDVSNIPSNETIKRSPTDFEGKNFLVTLELLNQTFDKSLNKVISKRFQGLREEIQNAILQLYQNDETYLTTKINEFKKSSNRSDSILVELIMRFSNVDSSHLTALYDKVKEGGLGKLLVGKDIINITRLSDILPVLKWCRPPCFKPYRCFPTCSSDCCAMPRKRTEKNIAPNNLLSQTSFPNKGFFYFKPQLYRNVYSYPLPCWPGCSSVCYPQCSFACCFSYQALKRP